MQETATQGLPFPLSGDGAALAQQLRQLALAGDAKFPNSQGIGGYGEFTDRGTTPAGVRFSSGSSTPINPNVETNLLFDGGGTISGYDNMGGSLNDLILPPQDQSYWWWVGMCQIMAAGAAVNTRFILRAYVQDTQPSTGIVTTRVLKQPYYSPGAGAEAIVLDGFVRSGGGRIRGTLEHTHNAGLTPQTNSCVWAVRVAAGA